MTSLNLYIAHPNLYPLLGFSILACQQEKPAREDDRPNTVLIMTNDQGYGDHSYHDNPDIKTPFLDSLFSVGTRFKDFHDK